MHDDAGGVDDAAKRGPRLLERAGAHGFGHDLQIHAIARTREHRAAHVVDGGAHAVDKQGARQKRLERAHFGQLERFLHLGKRAEQVGA